VIVVVVLAVVQFGTRITRALDFGGDASEAPATVPPSTAAPFGLDRQQTPPLTGVSAIEVGDDATCAVTGTSVSCWPAGGGSGPGPVEGLAAVAIDVLAGARVPGGGRPCALLGDGTIRCWGTDEKGPMTGETGEFPLSAALVTGIDDAVDVAVGSGSVCVVHASGGVSCWGSLSSSPVPVRMPDVADAVSVSAFTSRTCALHRDGHETCWTRNGAQVDTTRSSSPAGSVAVDRSGSMACAMVHDATVQCWGGVVGSQEPVPVPGITGVTSISVGGARGCVTLGDGSARCFGSP
jgi:hypothetical protein